MEFEAEMGKGQFINRERERESVAKSSGLRIFGGARER